MRITEAHHQPPLGAPHRNAHKAQLIGQGSRVPTRWSACRIGGRQSQCRGRLRLGASGPAPFHVVKTRDQCGECDACIRESNAVTDWHPDHVHTTRSEMELLLIAEDRTYTPRCSAVERPWPNGCCTPPRLGLGWQCLACGRPQIRGRRALCFQPII